ncbi:hypothetical protein [Myroides odoratus]|uniref:hypothetical protein n=1 Tax=Myroides odoratus TaxID=256 RepID=UPI0039B09FA3
MKLNDITNIEKNQEFLLIKVKNAEHLVKLSLLEFAIIEQYCRMLNKESVIAFFSDTVEIKMEQLDLLLGIAIQNKLLVEQDFSNGARFFFFRLKRKKAILEVLNIDFTHTFFERIWEKKCALYCVLVLLIGLVVGASIYLLIAPFSLVENYKNTLYQVPYSFKQLLFFIYLGALISIGIHEFGHYFVYKWYKGKCSIFGFGLLLYVIPVFYNKLYIGQVKNKKHRVFIHAGGFVFDFIVVILVLLCTVLFHSIYPTVVFICYSIAISVCIRSLFNLNLFLPYTDGYFILNVLVKKENLFKESSAIFFHLFKGKLTSKRILYSGYFVLSCLAIAFVWFCFATPLFLLFYYAFNT